MPALDREICNLTIAATHDWKRWLMGLSRYTRSTRSSVVDAALVEYARARGYAPEAPPRCPGQEGAS